MTGAGDITLDIIILASQKEKAKGDCRTINKTPMLYRMILRMDGEIRQWELDNKSKFDAACIGSSALTAALKRNVWAEVVKFLDGCSACAFNDFGKLFDTLDIPTLLNNHPKT